MNSRILVAGVGNIFLGDDGFGVEVARRLSRVSLPDGVTVADFGIRGVHLAYQLLDEFELVVLVDAVSRGGVPGTLYVIEPEVDGRSGEPIADAHDMVLEQVFAQVRTLGGKLGRVLLVGCEAEDACERIGLSQPVQNAVNEAVRVVVELVGQRSSNATDQERQNSREAGTLKEL
jgi:hydrogenase maturation protease